MVIRSLRRVSRDPYGASGIRCDQEQHAYLRTAAILPFDSCLYRDGMGFVDSCTGHAVSVFAWYVNASGNAPPLTAYLDTPASWTLAHLKAHLEPITGVPPGSQQLTLQLGSQPAVALSAANKEQTQLSARDTLMG
jgi:hypothetical protein